MQLSYTDFMNIMNIGVELTTQKDKDRLLHSILEKGMEITHCDASTLYLYEEDKLKFKIMKTLSQNISRGENGEAIHDMPPVPFVEQNVCAYTAINHKIVNIPDVYNSEQFDFSGPKNYDKLTGYRTKSMLVIPLENSENELIGVLQMINAKDENGAIVPFEQQDEVIIRSLGSLAAITLTNIQYVTEIKSQLHSFVEAFATAVDQRTPYNGWHTRNMAQIVLLLAGKINEKHMQQHGCVYFNDSHLEKLELAALLHDIGKMVTPRDIMNRATRLEKNIKLVEGRFELLEEYCETDYLKGKLTKQEYDEKCTELKYTLLFVKKINEAYSLTLEEYDRIQNIAAQKYKKENGDEISYLTEEERDCLSIWKGNLTPSARKVMQEHVEYTSKILEKVHFNKNYKDIRIWTGQHHEFLDGTGYPNQKKGDEIPIESRILVISDIYEALTASDRPYKKSMSQGEAIKVLKEMAKAGKLDSGLVELLYEAVQEELQ